MRWLGTVLFALLTSAVVGLFVAAALGLYFLSDGEAYVVLMMTALIAAVVAAVLFGVALLLPVRKGAVRVLGYGLLVVLALMAFGVAAVEFGAQGSVNAASRAIETAGLMFCSAALVVAMQWMMFRRAASVEKPLPEIRFGRQGARPQG
ncbi:MAG: hypothetical protein ABTQ31_13735 [Rhizobiaceae bacterium]